MSTATLDYLMEHDTSTPWDWPTDFDRRRELEHVRALGPELRAITGLPLRLDDKIQDATFFAEWASLDPVAREWPGVPSKVNLCRISVRFSVFGRLYTVWGNCPENPVSEATVRAIDHVLSPLGYVHVPEDLLFQPHPTDGPSKTWQSRFFAYW
jgi:hypothetical protein